MKVAEAATATVIGQIVAMSLAIYFNIRKNLEIKISFKNFKPNGSIIKKIYAVDIPSIVMMSIGSITVYEMNQILLSFTITATAVFGIYFKLQSFIMMPVMGLNNGMVPILAYNLGEKNKKRMIKTIKLNIIYATSITLIGLALMQLMPDKLLTLFHANHAMLSLGIPALQTISISFIFAGSSIVFLSVFQALGHGIMSLEVSVIRQLIVLLPVAYLLSLTGSINAIWWSYPIAKIFSVIFSLLFMNRVYKKEIKTIQSK